MHASHRYSRSNQSSENVQCKENLYAAIYTVQNQMGIVSLCIHARLSEAALLHVSVCMSRRRRLVRGLTGDAKS
jgi:hypothetical protein